MDDESIISDRTLEIEREERDQDDHASKLPLEDSDRDDTREPNVPQPDAAMPGGGTAAGDEDDRDALLPGADAGARRLPTDPS